MFLMEVTVTSSAQNRPHSSSLETGFLYQHHLGCNKFFYRSILWKNCSYFPIVLMHNETIFLLSNCCRCNTSGSLIWIESAEEQHFLTLYMKSHHPDVTKWYIGWCENIASIFLFDFYHQGQKTYVSGNTVLVLKETVSRQIHTIL